MTTLFNTLKYTKGAEAIGIKREHAEYQAQQMADLIEETLATKMDLKNVSLELTIRLGGIMIGCTGIAIATLSFILRH